MAGTTPSLLPVIAIVTMTVTVTVSRYVPPPLGRLQHGNPMSPHPL